MLIYLVFAVSIVLALLGLASRVLPATRDRTAAALLASLLPAGLAAWMAATGESPSAWLPPLGLAACCAALLAVRSTAAQCLLSAAARPPVQASTLLVAGAALFFWQSEPNEPHFSAKSTGPDWQPYAARAMASLRPEDAAWAVTDRGRPIRLLTMPSDVLWPETLEDMETDMAAEWGLSLQVLRTGPPDARSDCHGWIFADARWWVLGADVELILEDNGYRPVDDPQVGDLVIYRQGPAKISHTGIVFSAREDGPVLVESKWAWLGTYVHTVEAQPYGGSPGYYRSARDGHRLKISESP